MNISTNQDGTVDLDSSTSLEFDRRIIVQESADSVREVDVGRRAAGRQHCTTDQREILKEPFQQPDLEG